MVLLIALASNVHPVEASGTIYIRATGEVEGTDKIQRDGDIYTFTGDIDDEIVVERSNIIVDGKGHALRGAGSGYGFELRDLENVTIRNTSIDNFYSGIDLLYAYCCTLSGNNITATDRYGVQLRGSSNNNISENNIVENDDTGLHLFQSGNNVLRNNNMTANKHNFDVYGASLSDFWNDIDTSNTVNGKPIYYWMNKQDMSAPLDAGYLALIDCENITVKNLNIESNGQGILLAFTSNSTITRNNLTSNFRGIWSRSSTDNFIFKNNIAYNNDNGIFLYRSSNNTVFENNITNNTWCGVDIEGYSSSNRIRENNIVNSEYGITIREHSYDNHISGNHMADHSTGIRLIYSANNTLCGNNMTSNDFCFFIWESSNNSIYHNNFMHNTEQGWFLNATNIWDDGYPSGGNYWSNYNGTDLHVGPGQNIAGEDGIGDNPYVIDENNQDNYPLIHPYGSIRNVNTSLTYLTIQAAIDAPETLDNHTILVDTGIYSENVEVEKSLTIQSTGGAESTIVQAANPNDHVFSIEEDYVNIAGFSIRGATGSGAFAGIFLFRQDFCSISANILYLNQYGILLGDSASHNTVSNNVIYGNGTNKNTQNGILLDAAFFTTIVNNSISLTLIGGIRVLDYSSNNTISSNVVDSSGHYGIDVIDSNRNIIKSNKITNCGEYGLDLRGSNDNLIFRNSFINNIHQVRTVNVVNVFSASYPFGGNYWSDYSGTDSDSDGIGDTPYVIDANNTDNYPLMGMFSDFTATSEHHVQTVCNSTISAFQFDGTAISFNVTGEDGTIGFCRACIPTAVMNATYMVFVNGTEVAHTLLPCSNSTHSYLYFSYSHSTQDVVIIPEFPSILILPLLMALTLGMTVLLKKRRLYMEKDSQLTYG